MQISLHIETHDRRLGFEMAATGNTLRSGTAVSVPGGATLEYTGTFVCKSVGIPEVLQFIIDASISIDLGLFSAWLYDKVKEKPVERIIVNRRVITTITKETIRQVLEEEIRSRE